MSHNYNTFDDAQLVSDFFEVGDWIEVDEDPWPFPDNHTNNIPPAPVYTSTQMLVLLPPNSTRDHIQFGFGANNTFFHQEDTTTNLEESSSKDKDKEKEELGKKEKKQKEKEKVAFKTRSEVEVLDDGFKWRKYGKKMVKNSPNPRNYYRCCVEGCPVKKRVERDKEDPRYVVTTYEGIHNHTAPHLSA